MNVFDERDAYKESPYFTKHIYHDYSYFYLTITVCTVFALIIFIINIVLGCCSRHSAYWNDRHTGNRFILSIWTSTPHQQPPLDLTELEAVHIPNQSVVYTPVPAEKVEYLELQKRESDI